MSDYICPYTCSYRTNSGFCGHTGGYETCQYRQIHQPNTVVGYVPPLKQTHYEEIRAMSIEELAEFISGKARTFGEEYEGYMSALDWLKEEASDGLLQKL